MQQELKFTSKSGTDLIGILNNPNETIEGTPLMILCHGFTSSKNSITYTDLEESLGAKGIATFRFDFFGHGESGGHLSDITLSEAVDNALSAHDLMTKKGFTNIGLFGSSFGGCTALNVAAELNEKLTCLVCKAPVSDYAKQKERKLGEQGMKERKEKGYTPYYVNKLNKEINIKYKFYEDMAKNNVHKKAHKITIPTLIVHGIDDITVLPRHSEKTAEMIENCEIKMMPGGDHRMRREGEIEEVNKIFTDFISQHMNRIQ